MKRCPECRRDYSDDTLLFCLEDGAALVQGSVPSPDEPATAIFHDTDAPGETATRAQIHTTEQTAVLPSGVVEIPRSNGFDRRMLIIPAVLLVIVLGGFFGYRYFNASDSGQINSIAVLPFENRGGDADTDYLSDGLADSLIYRLSQLPDLKVSPTSSVMRYKGKEADVAGIAKDLGVDAVMTGRLVQRGDDLSISLQLIDVRNEKVIWAEQYDRKMADLMATQREIATTITQKLKLKLAGDESKGITKKYTDSNDAYQLYMRGRYYFAKRTKSDMLKSIEYFQQAIDLDANFALAYARIAEVYNQMSAYPYMSPKEAFPKAKSAAIRALEIDPTLSEAHAAMANSLAVYDWNWAEAEREFKEAIKLDPNNASAHFRYGQVFLGPRGRHDEAIAEMKRGLEIEPLDLAFGAILAEEYCFAEQFDRALEQAKKIDEIESNFVLGKIVLCEAYLGNEMYADAVSNCEGSLANYPESQWLISFVGYANAKRGHRGKAEEMLAKFREIGKTRYVDGYPVALIHVGMGDKDQAFTELEKAFADRAWFLHQLRANPLMAPLHGDPRYDDLLKRMGLPE